MDSVLRRHAGVDGAARWQALLASEFGGRIPVVVWLRSAWMAERVHEVLASMRECAAQCSLGIPLAVWKTMPEAWHPALARLSGLVES